MALFDTLIGNLSTNPVYPIYTSGFFNVNFVKMCTTMVFHFLTLTIC